VIAARAPSPLVERLEELARKEMRTLNNLIVHLLAKAVGWKAQ
jgi:hypothetical protein